MRPTNRLTGALSPQPTSRRATGATRSAFARTGEHVPDPSLVQRLLNDPRAGWIFVLPRVGLGYQWFAAALDKLSNPAWMQTGDVLKGFWTRALAVPATGAADIPAAGYRGSPRFLLAIQAYAGLARRVAYGELLIGLMLSAGAGLAALFGGLINWTYIMAGTASPNPLLFVMAVALILAWKVSGTIGADFSGCAGSARPGERRRRKPSLH